MELEVVDVGARAHRDRAGPCGIEDWIGVQAFKH